MTHFTHGKINLYNMDCMAIMLETPDKSQNLIIVDPPYFEVKGDFDFIWKSFDDYLKDVEKWAIECKRILADNGTLFWWGHAKKIAYTQIILDKYFSLESSIVWRKTDSIQYQYYSPELARSFNSHNERLLMYSNDHEPSEWAMTGTERIIEEHIKPRHPFALYLRDEFKRAGVTNKEIAKLFPSKTGGLTGCVSNWLNGDNTPTEEQYLEIRNYLNGDYLRKEYEDLRKEYEDLRKEYEDLRKEYEDLRRPFNNLMKLEDVLEFSQESHITKYHKHPTQKSPTLCRAIIKTCSKAGQAAFIPFCGSGTEVIECAKAGLIVTGTELDADYFQSMTKRVIDETKQQDLFAETTKCH